MTYLITGGTGFVGVEVVKQLALQGKSITIYDYQPFYPGLERVFGREIPKNVEVFAGDVTDITTLYRVISRNGIDRIIHLASLLVPASQANPPLAYKINCEGTLNLFEAARIFDIRKVVWASSMAVFGHFSGDEQASITLDDETPHSPDNIYGCCKSFCENTALQYNLTFKIDTLGIRLGLVYGPGKMRGEGLFTSALIDKPALGESSVVPFGDDVFNWQYVKDVAKVFILAADSSPAPKAVLNFESTIRPVHDAVKIMRELTPNVDITVTPGVLGFPSKINGSKLAKHINFTAEYSLEKGLEETVSDIQKQAKKR